MLSAIARLNPHVDMKKIVIGLMDRLSTYAQRESETVSAEDREKAEEDAVTKMLEKIDLNLTTDSTPVPAATKPKEPEINGPIRDETPPAVQNTAPESVAVNGDDVAKDSKPAVGEVLLFEIFYDQVVNLVKTRSLPIQDTMALLTSLVNLAL